MRSRDLESARAICRRLKEGAPPWANVLGFSRFLFFFFFLLLLFLRLSPAYFFVVVATVVVTDLF